MQIVSLDGGTKIEGTLIDESVSDTDIDIQCDIVERDNAEIERILTQAFGAQP